MPTPTARFARADRPIRVLVVDDHRVVREAIAPLLRTEPDLAVVGQAENGRVALERVAALTPDVVIMGVNRPILDGIQATRHLRADFPAVRVVALSMHEEQDSGTAMREAGAVAYVSKNAAPEALLAAIRGAVEGSEPKRSCSVPGLWPEAPDGAWAALNRSAQYWAS
jgi:DNA-binding NarL/FixJ family response regulator